MIQMQTILNAADNSGARTMMTLMHIMARAP